MPQKLIVDGVCVGEFETRAEALVVCFERNLVHDRFQRGKKNSLLPNVKIVGSDDYEPNLPVSRHPLDLVSNESNLSPSENPSIKSEASRSNKRSVLDESKTLPVRGSLDGRSDDRTPRRIKIDGVWRRQ